ncbi:MAG: hypothetical protein BIFFINMI_03798 [Phycisphaerae bacterium]|nr:hypothetical protein [Phycisphaerae bacterium]
MARRTITETDLRQAWAELLVPRQPLVVGRGKTIAEMVALGGESETTVRRRVRSLIAAGKLCQIGARPGSSRSAVFEIVTKEKK